MNVLIVYAHPEPKSFNGALKDLAVTVLTGKGHGVQVSDLYSMKFKAAHDAEDFLARENPEYLRLQPEEKHAGDKGLLSPDVKAEQEKLRWANMVILQAPLWWFSLPAILKGWVDRVMTFGFAYGPPFGNYDAGGMKGKRAMLSLTTGGPTTSFTPRGRSGDLDVVLWPVQHGILRFTGFDVLPPFIAWRAGYVPPAQRQQYLEEYRQRLLSLETTEPLSFHSNSEFENGQLRADVRGRTAGQRG